MVLEFHPAILTLRRSRVAQLRDPSRTCEAALNAVLMTYPLRARRPCISTMVSAAAETLRLLEAYSEAEDAHAREQLVTNYVPLVRKLCGRFRRSREPQEDLFQVGVLGLLNAIEKFDPHRGASFSSLAIPEILGAVLNYLRDHGNLIKVPRALRRNKLAVDRESDRLAARLGRWPTVSELAKACDLPEEDIHATMEFARVGEPRSLDERLYADDGHESVTLVDFVGCEDHQFDRSLDRIVVRAALDALPLRERTVIMLRYYKGMSQRQIAERIHISQMHVSRIGRSALLKLRMFVQRDVTLIDNGGPQPQAAAPCLPLAS